MRVLCNFILRALMWLLYLTFCPALEEKCFAGLKKMFTYSIACKIDLSKLIIRSYVSYPVSWLWLCSAVRSNLTLNFFKIATRCPKTEKFMLSLTLLSMKQLTDITFVIFQSPGAGNYSSKFVMFYRSSPRNKELGNRDSRQKSIDTEGVIIMKI